MAREVKTTPSEPSRVEIRVSPLSWFVARWKRLSRTARFRLGILALLLGIYYGVQAMDFFLQKYVLTHPMFTGGATKITLRHFRQPEEHPFSLHYWRTFLDNVVRHKPGILAKKWFYVVLLASYVILAVLVFFELTRVEDQEPERRPKE